METKLCMTCGKPGALEILLGVDTILISHASCLHKLDIEVNQLNIIEMRKQMEMIGLGEKIT